MTHYFGAHTSDNGGIHMAVRRAGAAEMRALQVFTTIPKYYGDKSSVKPERVARFQAALASTAIAPERVVAHAAYVLNTATHEDEKQPEAAPTGGGAIDGILMVLRSPYIAGITLWVALLSVAATFLYFEQAAIVAAASDDPAVRTRIFAGVDLAVGLLTIAVQFFATGKLIARFGVGAALALLPVVFAVGFAVLAVAPVLAVVIAFQALQRTANFAISNPAREVLFTVVARDEKYKAKNVIDIVAVRGADAAGGWLFTALRSLGMELRSIPLMAIGIAVACFVISVALGRAQERRAGLQRAV